MSPEAHNTNISPSDQLPHPPADHNSSSHSSTMTTTTNSAVSKDKERHGTPSASERQDTGRRGGLTRDDGEESFTVIANSNAKERTEREEALASESETAEGDGQAAVTNGDDIIREESDKMPLVATAEKIGKDEGRGGGLVISNCGVEESGNNLETKREGGLLTLGSCGDGGGSHGDGSHVDGCHGDGSHSDGVATVTESGNKGTIINVSEGGNEEVDNEEVGNEVSDEGNEVGNEKGGDEGNEVGNEEVGDEGNEVGNEEVGDENNEEMGDEEVGDEGDEEVGDEEVDNEGDEEVGDRSRCYQVATEVKEMTQEELDIIREMERELEDEEDNDDNRDMMWLEDYDYEHAEGSCSGSESEGVEDYRPRGENTRQDESDVPVRGTGRYVEGLSKSISSPGTMGAERRPEVEDNEEAAGGKTEVAGGPRDLLYFMRDQKSLTELSQVSLYVSVDIYFPSGHSQDGRVLPAWCLPNQNEATPLSIQDSSRPSYVQQGALYQQSYNQTSDRSMYPAPPRLNS